MKKFVLCVLILPCFIQSGFAEGIYEKTAESFDIYAVERGLDEDVLDISGRLKVDGSYETQSALSRLWDRLVTELRSRLGKELAKATELLAIALLCALATAMTTAKPMQSYISLAACCAGAISLLGGLDSLVSDTVSALRQMLDHSRAAMPALYTVAAASGALSSSAAKYAAVSVGIDIMMEASQKLLVPMIYAYLALSLAAAVSPYSLLSGIARLLKSLATTIMTTGTMAFAACLGMTGLVTGSIDAAALKAARTVISTALPVVGRIASDASAAVLSSAAVIRSSAGAFGLIAVAAMCLGPFAALSVRMLVLKAVSAAADMVADKRFTGLINSVAAAMGLLLGLLGCCAIMLFLSITAGIKAVVS